MGSITLNPPGITKAHLTKAAIGADYWLVDFKNYLGPTSSKQSAKAYLKNLSTMKEEGIGLLFAGPPGPGKTTLATIVLKYLARAGWDVFMTSLGEIVENIQKGWESKDEEHTEFLSRCREADFLLIDDLGKEHSGPSGFSATIFDNLIRHRVQNRQATFFTTNLNTKGIRNRYGDALLSLIEGKCRVVVVDAEDIRKTHLKKRIEDEFNEVGS